MNAPSGLLAMLAAVLLLTGCSSSSGESGSGGDITAPDSVIIIAGAHANMPAAQVPVEVAPQLEAAVHDKAPITVIANDGTPAVSFHTAGYTINTANSEAARNDVNGVTSAVIDAVKDVRIDADGNNLGAALAVARDQVNTDRAVAASIIVIDSGLTDLGYPLMTTPGILTAGTGQAVVDFATRNGYLPTMPQGTTVTFVGLGYSTAPQPDLTPTQRDAVKDVWRAFMEAAGATVITVDKPRTGPGPETLHTTTIIQPDIYEQLTIETSGTQTIVTLHSTTFAADSAALTDEAKTALGDIVQVIRAGTGAVVVTGYTDVGPTAYPGGNTGLSTDRAEDLKVWLVAQGVSPNRVTAVGKGDTEPVFPDPKTDAEREANRRVVLTFIP